MSANYCVYVGAYLKLDHHIVHVTKTNRVCSTCGTRYDNNEVYCSKDGNVIVDREYTDGVEVSSFWDLINEFDVLIDYEDEFCSPEYGTNCVMLSNHSNTHDSFDGESDSQVVDMPPAIITKYINTFNNTHKDVIKCMEDLGIKFELNIGVIGYWG